MIKSIRNTLTFVVIFGSLVPSYSCADAQKASTLRKKAVAMAVVSGISYWSALRAALVCVYIGCAPLMIAGGIASSVYAHKLRQARKQELKAS